MIALHLLRFVMAIACVLGVIWGPFALGAEPQAGAAPSAPSSARSISPGKAPQRQLPTDAEPSGPRRFPAKSFRRVILTYEDATTASAQFEHEACLKNKGEYLLELSDLATGVSDRQNGAGKSGGAAGLAGSVRMDVGSGLFEAAGAIGGAGTKEGQAARDSKAGEAIQRILSSLETVVYGTGSLLARPTQDNRGLLLHLVADGPRRICLKYRHPNVPWTVRYGLTIDDGFHAGRDSGALFGSVLLHNSSAYSWKDVTVTLLQDGVAASTKVAELQPREAGQFPLDDLRNMPIVARRIASYEYVAGPQRKVHPTVWVENSKDGGRSLLGGTLCILRDDLPFGEATFASPLLHNPDRPGTRTVNLTREPRLTITATPTILRTDTRWNGSLLTYSHKRMTVFTITNHENEHWTVVLSTPFAEGWKPEGKLEPITVQPLVEEKTEINETVAEQHLDLLHASLRELDGLRKALERTRGNEADVKRLSAILLERQKIEQADNDIAGFRTQLDLLARRQEVYLTTGLRRSDLRTLFGYQDTMKNLASEIDIRERQRVKAFDEILRIFDEPLK